MISKINKVKAIRNIPLIIYSLYIVFLCAQTSDFAKSLPAHVIFIVASIILLFKKSKTWYSDKFGFRFIITAALIVFIQYIRSDVFMLGSAKFIILIICIYYVLKQYKLVFFDTLVNTIYYLTIITIPFYLIQLVDPNALKPLLSPFSMSFKEQGDYGGLYVFFFNWNPWGIGIRNCGFMWEPAAFGGMLLFTMVYMYLRNNFQINKKVLLLFLYAITTLSTSTFVGLFVLLTLMVVNINKKRIYRLVFYIPILVIVVIQVNKLPFMGDKLDYYFEHNTDYQAVYALDYRSHRQSIGRFAGFLIEIDKLKENPVFGSGWNRKYDSIGIGIDWVNPNGLAALIGKFGGIGIIFILAGLFWLNLSQSKLFLYQKILIIILILIPLFSNPFQTNLLFWSFVMYGIINRNNNLNKIIVK